MEMTFNSNRLSHIQRSMEPEQHVLCVTALGHALVKSDLDHTNEGYCWFDGSRGKHVNCNEQMNK